MKVRHDYIPKMTMQMKAELKQCRDQRGFDALDWVSKKTDLIAEYFTTHGLKAAVIGVSGGVDSAVAYALLKQVQRSFPEVLTTVVPIAIPHHSAGASHQDDALQRARDLCQTFGDDLVIFNELSSLTQTVTSSLSQSLNMEVSDWALGQSVAYCRTPVFYTTCSILSDNGLPAVIVGTTNLSEGGYIGYVGKASDGMTDVQVISDLFKSEVYEVGGFFGIPESIMTAEPNGDMYDGVSDEHVFGCSYDFLELYMVSKMSAYKSAIPSEIATSKEYHIMSENVEQLHQYNKHKYLYHMPSVFLEVLPTRVEGGWNNIVWKKN